jgi:hypothetical protein
MPVTGSLLAMTGLRLRTLTWGLKPEVKGVLLTLVLASRKWNVSLEVSLRECRLALRQKWIGCVEEQRLTYADSHSLRFVSV